ncbi:MAG: hypothetical protein QXK51_11510 [Candidatus Methanomethylicia archaeon]
MSEEYNKAVLEALRSIVTKLDELKPKETREVKEPSKMWFRCKGCGFESSDPQAYLEHIAGETIRNEVEKRMSNLKLPTPQEMLKSCEGDICKLIEGKYDVRKKGERWF